MQSSVAANIVHVVTDLRPFHFSSQEVEKKKKVKGLGDLRFAAACAEGSWRLDSAEVSPLTPHQQSVSSAWKGTVRDGGGKGWRLWKRCRGKMREREEIEA